MDSIDLSTLDTRKGAEAGFDLQLTHPQTGEALTTPNGAAVTLRLLGADSDTYARTLRGQNDRFLAKQARNRRARRTPQELEEETIELIAAVTVGWTGLTLDGKPFDHSADNARTLYRRFPWALDQAHAAIFDRGNFLPKSPTS